MNFIAVCDKYDNSLKTEKPPDLVLDFTQTGITSETVKSFTHALALPTVSASYGQEDDLRYTPQNCSPHPHPSEP